MRWFLVFAGFWLLLFAAFLGWASSVSANLVQTDYHFHNGVYWSWNDPYWMWWNGYAWVPYQQPPVVAPVYPQPYYVAPRPQPFFGLRIGIGDRGYHHRDRR